MDDKLTSHLDLDTTGAASEHTKRRRVSLACDACRRKKIKCNGTKPTCQNCAASKKECKYTPSERKECIRKRGTRKSTLSAIELRLRNIEFTLLDLSKVAMDKPRKKRQKPIDSTEIFCLETRGLTKPIVSNGSSPRNDHENIDKDQSETVKIHPDSVSTGNSKDVLPVDLNGKNTSCASVVKMEPDTSGLVFGPPRALTEDPIYLNLQARKQRLFKVNPDLVNATLVKTSNIFYLGESSFFLCSPVVLRWIADKTGDNSVVPNATRMIYDAYMAGFEAFRSLAKQNDHPTPIPASVLTFCVQVFKKTMKISSVISSDELDQLVENELNVSDDISKRNGLAEKTILHAVTALCLLLFQGVPETMSSLPFKFDMSDVYRQLNSSYYYFFRFSIIGNSIMGVKAGALLLLVSMFSLYHNPTRTISAIALRLAQSRGLHQKKFTAKLSPIEAERQHRLWWTIYMLEKSVTMKFGIPSMIDDDNITTPLPVYNPSFEDDTDGICFLRTQSELLLIWSKVNSLMTMSDLSLATITTKDRLLRLLQLDHELEDWAQRLPDKIKFTHENMRSYNFDMNVFTSDAWNFQFCTLLSHSSYYFVKITIYRFIAFHPGWIYKVSSENDDDHESNDSPPPPPSSLDERTKFKQPSQQQHRAEQSWVERYNGVKLIPRQIAKDNPSLMESFKIALDCSRKSIYNVLSVEFSPVQLFSTNMLLLNSYITLYIKCLMLPLDPETESDLKLLEVTVDIFLKVCFFLRDIWPQNDKNNLLGFLKDVVQRFVVKKKIEKEKEDFRKQQQQQQQQHDDEIINEDIYVGMNCSSSFSLPTGSATVENANLYDVTSASVPISSLKPFPGPSEIAQSPVDHNNLTLPPFIPAFNNIQTTTGQGSGPASAASQQQQQQQQPIPSSFSNLEEAKTDKRDSSNNPNSIFENLMFLEDPGVFNSLFQLFSSWEGGRNFEPWTEE